MKIVRVRITGLVQGVGYRAFVEREARRRRLEGWVRNRRDRSVEVVLAGPAEVVGETIMACRWGPPGSRVEEIETIEADALALADACPGQFLVLPTI